MKRTLAVLCLLLASCAVPVRVVDQAPAPHKFGATVGVEYNLIVIPSSASNMTGAVVLTSTAVLLAGRTDCSFHAVWTGTPTGTFSFEFSNDLTSTAASVVNWTAATLPAAFAAGNPAGSASSFGFEFSPITFRWLRTKYTNSASTGTLFVTAEAK